MCKKSLFKLAAALAATVGLGPVASAASVCPTTVNTNSDCGYILTIGSGDKITGAAVAGANPFDGSDDSLIGVVNNSGSVYNGSFTLSGSGNGGGLFSFDCDCICTFTNASYCASAPTGYEGPLNTFSNINAAANTGTVNIKGLAAGGSTFFSLESAPSSINPIIGGGTPEPGTNVLLGGGLLLFGILARKQRLFGKR